MRKWRLLITVFLAVVCLLLVCSTLIYIYCVGSDYIECFNPESWGYMERQNSTSTAIAATNEWVGTQIAATVTASAPR